MNNFKVILKDDGGRNISSHDDRSNSPYDDRGSGDHNRSYRGRGSYRREPRGRSRGRNSNSSRGRTSYQRSAILNEDETMENLDSAKSHNRFAPYIRGGHRHNNRGNHGNSSISSRLGLPLNRGRNNQSSHGRYNNRPSHSNQKSGQYKYLDETSLPKVKEAMSNKYESSTRSLDLTNFYKNPELNKNDIYIRMHEQHNIEEILKVIKENIPELSSLNLTDNRLSNLTFWSKVKEAAPQLKTLNLSNNNLRTEQDLEVLKGLSIKSLMIEGNPFSSKQNTSRIISLIRKIFPDLSILDGQELPATIKFDIETNCKLPPNKPSFFGNNNEKLLIISFITEYFKFFDSNERQKLFDAYHENAIFSIGANMVKPSYSSYSKHQHVSLPTRYISDSRNLLKIYGQKRHNLLKRGKLSIVAYLNDSFPATKHDVKAMLIDVCYSSPQLIMFTVNGLFTEQNTNDNDSQPWAFNRTFITVPQNSGFVIINEQLNISCPTRKQLSNSSPHLAPTPSSSPVHAEVTIGSPAQDLSVDLKRAMVSQFSDWSKMKLEYSEKFLQQYNWNPEKSGEAFNEMKLQNTIPPEAFM